MKMIGIFVDGKEALIGKELLFTNKISMLPGKLRTDKMFCIWGVVIDREV